MARSVKKVTSLCTLVLVLCLWSWPLAAQVIINEVLCHPDQDWDGDGTLSFKGDEWIEVINTGSLAVNLDGYYLRDIFGTDPHLQLHGRLEPGAVAVFFGSEAMAWQLAHGFSDYGFALNNTGETVELLSERGQPGDYDFELVDSVTVLPHETDQDRSSGWAEDGSGWVLYDALNEYGGSLVPLSSGCQPTPGEPNACVPLVPLQKETLGNIKAFFH